MAESSSRRISNICVFCGSSSGNSPKFVKTAQELGRVMAQRNIHLVYGGGDLGLMGDVSKAVQERGSQVLGIIPRTLAEANLIGKTNGEEKIISSMSERLTEMINHVDAFIALPGGLGTLEEILTVVSWANLNIHQKPIGLLNVERFFNFLFIFFADIKRLGFLTKLPSDIFICSQTADKLIDRLQAYEPKIDPILSKLDWSDNDHGKKRRLDLNLNL